MEGRDGVAGERQVATDQADLARELDPVRVGDLVRVALRREDAAVAEVPDLDDPVRDGLAARPTNRRSARAKRTFSATRARISVRSRRAAPPCT